MKKWVLLVLIVFLSGFASAALGLTPAKMVFDYEPGKIIDLKYKVFADGDVEIETYAEGDLAEHVIIDKSVVKAGESFNVKIILPQDISKPGENKLFIGVREKQDSGGTIGSLVNIRALVVVFVPYPGRYVEGVLSVGNGNIGDEVNVNLDLVNRGREAVDVNSRVDFYSSDGKISELTFPSLFLDLNEKKTLKGVLNTQEFKPGRYVANAFYNYGEEKNVSAEFRIGSLFVNVTDYTDVLEKGGIQRFYIEIESLWNDDLSDVFADVNISNGVQSRSFRTPSNDLKAWNKDTLEGFVDTEDMDGEYDVRITLNYDESQTITEGKVVIKEGNSLLVILVIVGVLVLAVVAWFVIRKRKK